MTTTITRDSDGASTTPTLVVFPIESADASRNLIHRTLDGGIAMSIYPLDPAAGELMLLYFDEDSARAARALHRPADTFTFTDSIHPSRDMTYAVSPQGTRLMFDEATGKRWTLAVGYQEIVP